MAKYSITVYARVAKTFTIEAETQQIAGDKAYDAMMLHKISDDDFVSDSCEFHNDDTNKFFV